jgi:hypothetical protein
MRIDLFDPRVGKALMHIKESHKTSSAKELEEVFKRVYHCEIVSTDPVGHTAGYMEISEDKYQTWFLVQFGGDNDE